MNEAKLSLQQWRTVEATSGGTRRAKQRWSKGTTTQGCQMTYSNDSNKKNNMRNEGHRLDSRRTCRSGGHRGHLCFRPQRKPDRHSRQQPGELFSDNEPTITGGSACHYGLSGYYKHVPSGHEPMKP